MDLIEGHVGLHLWTQTVHFDKNPSCSTSPGNPVREDRLYGERRACSDSVLSWQIISGPFIAILPFFFFF